MKKFLTVLLVIAVMFTFSFGSAFAATTYDADDYALALGDEMSKQLTYLANAKTQVMDYYEAQYDEDGFVTIGSTDYMKAAIEAGADQVIADLEDAMDEVIDTTIEALGSATTTVAPDRTVVSAITKECLTGEGMINAMKSEAAVKAMNKVQAPLTKAYIEAQLDVDYTLYNAEDEVAEYGNLTAVEYIEKLVDDAEDAIATAAKQDSYADQIKGYEEALTVFKAALKKVATLEDEAIASGEADKTVDAAVNKYLAYGVETVYPALKVAEDDNLTQEATAYAPFYKKNGSKGAIYFGVEVADKTELTKAEATAINNAIYAAIKESAAVVKVYANGDASVVAKLYEPTGSFVNTLANSMKVADVYADVVELGEEYKSEYKYGVKVYDDEKVNEAVAAAKELVYADLDGTLKTAETYLSLAADGSLYAENYEIQALVKAINEAQDKFEGSIVKYGDNKTAEADKVYKKELYANSEKWAEIAEEAIAALEIAQSFAEVDEIMADAADDLAGLLLKDNATDVAEAIDAYSASLESYKALQYSLADKDEYSSTTFEAAVKAGIELMEDAITVEEVAAAYEEAKAIVDNVKSDDELDAMKEAVEAAIKALPYTSKLTVADKETVVAAYEAYEAYIETPGAEALTAANKSTLMTKLEKVLALAAEEIADAAEDLVDKLDDVKGGSDADVAAYIALKADAEALVAEADALEDLAADADIKVVLGDDVAAIRAALKITNNEYDYNVGTFYSKEIAAVESALVKAGKTGATAEEMAAAMSAYKALTDRQQYQMDDTALTYIEIVEQKLAASVEALKITASSTAKKGSITVKWTVKGETAGVEGYEIWKSTKKNSGYSKSFTTTKMSYKNTKGLKKGTRYYYKVRAIAYTADGTKVTSDWSNKAYRKAK